MDREIIYSFNQLDPRTEGETYLLNKFESSHRFRGWTIFEQPHINSMKPDFILLHPNKGIVIIEVKDWDLSSGVYEDEGCIRGTNGKRINKNPINQVENYKKMILKSELENSVYLSEAFDDDFFGCIETVVYFHRASREAAIRFCGRNQGYTKIWVRDDIDYISDTNERRISASKYTFALTLYKSKFNNEGRLEKLVSELKSNLQCSDYNYERKQPIKLTYEQEKLAKLQKNAIRRWSGVAGAGKSVALAQKVVNALKEGNRVLVLTFNITLRHYLRDLCSQQFGVATYEGERRLLREKLTISHFHSFLQIIMTEYEIEVESNEDDEIEFTQKWIDAINTYVNMNNLKKHLRYDYILIDEGQDFQGEWIRFLKQFFTTKGEIFIVYDKAQDLYEHGVWIEDSNQIKDIGFKGQPGNLKLSMRLPEKIVYLIEETRKIFNIEAEQILTKSGLQQSLIEVANWINCSACDLSEKLYQIEEQVNILRKTNVLEDITILTTNENTGVEIAKRFEARGIKTSHVYDLNRKKDYKKRRNEKWKFQGGTGRLKVCSYHSYKGWETPNIILVLDPPTTNYNGEKISFKEYKEQSIFDAIFISLSRVKNKALTGEYSFTCMSYLPEYGYVKSIFE
ncbi:MAG: NERD domain-containing protein [Sarcina sp.]